MKKEPEIPQSPNVATMCEYLKGSGIDHVCELQFHPVRKFRFDIAIPSLKLAIEYEGIMNIKGGTPSRHTSILGYSKDCEKYNLATIEGWRVLRYTALNYKQFYVNIHQIINNLRKLSRQLN